jgi:hypothetical protein
MEFNAKCIPNSCRALIFLGGSCWVRPALRQGLCTFPCVFYSLACAKRVALFFVAGCDLPCARRVALFVLGGSCKCDRRPSCNSMKWVVCVLWASSGDYFVFVSVIGPRSILPSIITIEISTLHYRMLIISNYFPLQLHFLWKIIRNN